MQLKFLLFTFSLHTLGIINTVTSVLSFYSIQCSRNILSQSCFGFESLDEDF